MSRHGLRHGAQRHAILRRSIAIHTARCTVCTVGVWVTIQFLYHDRGETTRRVSRLATRPVRARHGQGRCDTAQCAPCDTVLFTLDLGTRLGHSARAAWVPWVCSLCTQPSFDPVHYLQSLFGSLFMDTVHRVLKKIKIKYNKTFCLCMI